jgi:hypothetical protein
MTLIIRVNLYPQFGQTMTDFFSFPKKLQFNVLETTGAKQSELAVEYDNAIHSLEVDSRDNWDRERQYFRQINRNTHLIVSGEAINSVTDRLKYLIKTTSEKSWYNKYHSKFTYENFMDSCFDKFMPAVEIMLILLKKLKTSHRVISWLEPPEGEPQTFLRGRRIVKFLELCLEVLSVSMGHAVTFNNQEVINEIDDTKKKIVILIRKLNLEPIMRNVDTSKIFEFLRSEQIFHILITEQRFEENKVSPNVRRVIQNSDLNRYILGFI